MQANNEKIEKKYISFVLGRLVVEQWVRLAWILLPTFAMQVMA